MAKKNVAVLGAGMMGTGIAQLLAAKGHKVMLIYVYDDKVRAKPVENMRGNLQVLLEQGVIEEHQIEETIANVSFTESLEEAAESDWNVEDHISSFPPTYILHGDNDHACDFINSRILADALQNAGIPYEFEIGHGMDHGFGEALFSELRGWIERSVAFLNKIEGVAERK